MPNDKITEDHLAKMEAKKVAYGECFNSKSGKAVMEDLERACHYNASTIDKDVTILAFREGQRSTLLHIKTMIRFDIEKIKKIIAQQNKGSED